jgi:transposase
VARGNILWGVCAEERQYRGDVHHGRPSYINTGGEVKLHKQFLFFLGIDWATEEHRICLLDADGRRIAERNVKHSGAGIQDFLDWIVQRTGPAAGQLAIAIEVPRGAIVEALVDRCYDVFSINPKQLDRFRDRYTVAGAKDDSRDAFVLADSIRTDIHCFQRVNTAEPLVIRIRELSRLEHDMQQDWSRLTNQLRDHIHRYYPQLLRLSPAADEPWMWELLKMAPLPARGSRLRKSTVQQVLTRFRIRRLSAEQVLTELKMQPLPVAAGTAEAASEACLLIIPRLSLLYQQRLEIGKRIESVLDQLTEANERHGRERDVEVLRSLPGVGRIVAATILAEAPQPLSERNYAALRAYAGIAPVTRQSGKKKQVIMRYGCNVRLREALYHWSRISVQIDDYSRHHYHRLRASGHSHGRALRGIGDRLLSVLISMLKNQTTYDPTRRAGNQMNTRPAQRTA